MIQLKNVHKSYGQTKVLKGIDLQIQDQDDVVILGPSGSGKSTLLNVLSGLEKVDEGHILIQGQDLSQLTDAQLTAFRREKIAFIFQQYYLLPNLTVRQNVKMGADLANNHDFLQIIEDLGLGDKLDKYPSELSGGEQQRVSIARALAKKPEILFLDEPTGALDEETGRKILDYIWELKEKLGFTLIMVTHNQNIADMARTIIRVNSGKITQVVTNDQPQLEISKTNPMIQTYYDAQVSLSWMVAMVSGVVLSLTSILLMCFYIKQFVDDHKEQLGILKALGYSNGQLAKRFWAFGLSFGAGALLGYFASFLMMGHFYDFRNEKGILPEITIHFHWQLLLALVMLPTTFFMVLAIGYARRQLQTPALRLLKKSLSPIKVKRRKRVPKKENGFLKELSSSLIWGRKSILFFVVFGSMCFAAMVQLSFGLRDYTDDIIQTMMIMIGLILSFSILFLSLGIVVSESRETLALMKAFGYTDRECQSHILAPYRFWAYLGFVLGTVYQYGIMEILIGVIKDTVPEKIEHHFDGNVCFWTLLGFAVVYESLFYLSNRKLQKQTIKEVLLAE